jgi:thiamine-monophosphate kinase
MDDGLGQRGEFGIIDLFREQGGAAHAWVSTGIGDDCAVLDTGGGTSLLVTTDMLAEGVHFLRSGSSPWRLGWKSLAVNISDIAAMGGEPAAAFLALGLTPDIQEKFLLEFRDGLFACAAEYRVDLLGGDTIRTRSDLVFSLTLLGRAASGRVVKRSGARPGDRVMLGGPVGESAAGLQLLGGATGNLDSADREQLLRAHLEPHPQVALGRLLARNGLARAMIDVSDGLLQDLGHICRESGVGADIDTGRLPLSDALCRAAESAGADPLEWALRGGEDYVLLFCVPPGLEEPARSAGRGEPGIDLLTIGEITSGPGIRVCRDGIWTETDPAGFTHF